MPCGAADTCKSFGVLHIEEKERRTQSEVFTATDRTGSREGRCHRERRAALRMLSPWALRYSYWAIWPPRVCHLPTLRAYLSTKDGARGAPGYFRRLCLNHSQT